MCRRFGKLDVKSPGSTGRGRSVLPNLRSSEEDGIPGVVVKCVDIGRNTSGEAVFWDDPDAQTRKLGERTGLETPVVLAVNDVDLASEGSKPSVS